MYHLNKNSHSEILLIIAINAPIVLSIDTKGNTKTRNATPWIHPGDHGQGTGYVKLYIKLLIYILFLVNILKNDSLLC